MKTRTSCITLLAVAVLGAADKNPKPWWPQFRGPNSSGLGGGKPPVHFGPGQNVLWKTAVGSGLSSPIVWGERIFLTEFDRTSKQLATLCIDRRTGKILWRRAVAAEKIEEVHELGSPAAPTPATDGERVYVYFGSYGLLCYDLDGNLKWERRLPLPENPYGATASPIVAGELLVLNHQGKDAYLLAVNRRDGRTVWKTDRSSFQYRMVDSRALASRRDRRDCRAGRRLRAEPAPDGIRPRDWSGAMVGRQDCRRAGKARRSLAAVCCSWPRRTLFWSHAAEKRNPDRAAQFYANNAARVMAVRPGGTGEVTADEYRLVGEEGCARRSFTAVLQRTPLYFQERRDRFLSSGRDRQVVVQRTAGSPRLLLLLAGRCRQ